MVTISMSSLLAVRGATEAFCSFVAGVLPGQQQRQGLSDLWTLGCVSKVSFVVSSSASQSRSLGQMTTIHREFP